MTEHKETLLNNPDGGFVSWASSMVRSMGFVQQNHTVGLLAGDTSFRHELTSCTRQAHITIPVEGTQEKKISRPTLRNKTQDTRYYHSALPTPP